MSFQKKVWKLVAKHMDLIENITFYMLQLVSFEDCVSLSMKRALANMKCQMHMIHILNNWSTKGPNYYDGLFYLVDKFVKHFII